MKRKIAGPILLSMLAIMLCCTLIAAGTFALFSDEVNVAAHLSAGKLKIGLERVSLTKNEPDGEGYLRKTTLTDAAYHDYSAPAAGEPNIFGIENGVLLLPGCFYEAGLELTNRGDVAFDWWLEITLKNPSETEISAADLAAQLLVTVTDKTADDPDARSLITEAGSAKAGASALSDGVITVGDAAHPAGHMAAGGAAQALFVRVTFPDLAAEENNKAQGESVWFDLSFHAVQSAVRPE